MAFFKENNLDIYIDQWLKTATDGKVVCERAVLTDRFKFVCTECKATQTCSRPKDEHSLEYVVREFVNLHAHRPGHERLEKELAIQKGKVVVAQAQCPHNHKVHHPTISDPTASTTEICLQCSKIFPSVPFKPLDPSGKAIIDKDLSNQKKIEYQMAKYKQEMEIKAAEQQAKIEKLQEQAKLAELAKAQEKKEQEDYLKNIDITILKDNGKYQPVNWQPGKVIDVQDPSQGLVWISPNAWGVSNGTTLPNTGTMTLPGTAPNNIIPFPNPLNPFISPPPPPPEPPKPKALKPKTGRRFR